MAKLPCAILRLIGLAAGRGRNSCMSVVCSVVRQRPLFRGVAARPGYVLSDVFWVASVVRQRPLFRGVAARPGYVLGDVLSRQRGAAASPLQRGGRQAGVCIKRTLIIYAGSASGIHTPAPSQEGTKRTLVICAGSASVIHTPNPSQEGTISSARTSQYAGTGQYRNPNIQRGIRCPIPYSMSSAAI